MKHVKLFEEFMQDLIAKQLNESNIVPGTKVTVDGKNGTIVNWSDETKEYTVTFEDGKESQCKEEDVKVIETEPSKTMPENPEHFTPSNESENAEPGSHVKVKETGEVGQVIAWSDDTEKYTVELESGKTAEFSEEELEEV